MALALSHRQSSELITAILGRGEIPLKFVYMTDRGAEAWSNLASARSSTEVRGINLVEANLLTSKIDSFLQAIGDSDVLNIIDIGCGEGSPVLPLLDAIAQRSVQFRYVPVDISQQMLDAASSTVGNKYPDVDIRPQQLDFELGNFADITYDLREGGAKNLLLFLGTTLGNQPDHHRVLINMRDSMTSEDYLIIGVELVNLSKINKILTQYQGSAVDEFVFAMAQEIGLTPDDGELVVQFNEDKSQIELTFKLQHDTELTIGKEHIKLERDDPLLLARSHKFSEWLLVRLLQDVGFRIEMLTTSREKGYSLVMCQPSRFSY